MQWCLVRALQGRMDGLALVPMPSVGALPHCRFMNREGHRNRQRKIAHICASGYLHDKKEKNITHNCAGGYLHDKKGKPFLGVHLL